jgi:hypothetical protein
MSREGITAMKNWWYYYKWYVICGMILFFIACHLIGRALGIGKKEPDVQIAYVGQTSLPDETVAALENAFSSIAGDYNGDGSILVTINQYVSASNSEDTDSVYYEYASEVSLIGDISNCESYFFLTDAPSGLQRSVQILANADGSCPADNDLSIDGKVIQWSDSALLSELELGSYSTIVLGDKVNGDSDELVSGLYLGRRCFTSDKTTANLADCEALWAEICAE